MISQPVHAHAQRPMLRVATFAVAVLAPVAAWAVCTCGFQDGLFTPDRTLVGFDSQTTTAASDYQPLATDIVTDVITIVLAPELLVTKQLVTVEDPINNTTDPKAIPGRYGAGSPQA